MTHKNVPYLSAEEWEAASVRSKIDDSCLVTQKSELVAVTTSCSTVYL